MSTQPSNFTSNFGGSTPIDLLSSTSGIEQLTTELTGTYQGRHIFIGDLLIQFTDISYNSSLGTTQTGGYKINFKIPYTTKPYGIFLSPFNLQGDQQNYWSAFSIYDIEPGYFKVRIGNTACILQFIVIGKKP
jgi:hypothetical protein